MGSKSHTWDIVSQWLEPKYSIIVEANGPRLFYDIPDFGDVNYVPADRGPILFWTSIISLVVAMGFVAARLWVKSTLAGEVWAAEDFTLLAATVANLGYTILNCFAIKLAHVGMHVYDLGPDTIVIAVKLLWMQGVIYPFAIFLTKLSLALFYLRFLPATSILRKLTIAYIVYTLAYTIAAQIVLTFACLPVGAPWDLFIRSTAMVQGNFRCVNEPAMWYSLNAIYLITDLIILLIPIPTVWHLQVGLKQRLAVIGLFSLGLVACLVAGLKVIFLRRVIGAADFTWESLNLILCSQIETTLAIISFCIPALRPLIRKLRQTASTVDNYGSLSEDTCTGGTDSSNRDFKLQSPSNDGTEGGEFLPLSDLAIGHIDFPARISSTKHMRAVNSAPQRQPFAMDEQCHRASLPAVSNPFQSSPSSPVLGSTHVSPPCPLTGTSTVSIAAQMPLMRRTVSERKILPRQHEEPVKPYHLYRSRSSTSPTPVGNCGSGKIKHRPTASELDITSLCDLLNSTLDPLTPGGIKQPEAVHLPDAFAGHNESSRNRISTSRSIRSYASSDVNIDGDFFIAEPTGSNSRTLSEKNTITANEGSEPDDLSQSSSNRSSQYNCTSEAESSAPCAEPPSIGLSSSGFPEANRGSSSTRERQFRRVSMKGGLAPTPPLKKQDGGWNQNITPDGDEEIGSKITTGPTRIDAEGLGWLQGLNSKVRIDGEEQQSQRKDGVAKSEPGNSFRSKLDPRSEEDKAV